MDRGLFCLAQDNRTLVPNPNSGTLAWEDHLAQFALLGRIFGLALLHKEVVPPAADLNGAFVRLLLDSSAASTASAGSEGQSGAKDRVSEKVEEDVAALDPDAYEKKILYIREHHSKLEEGGATILAGGEHRKFSRKFFCEKVFDASVHLCFLYFSLP